MAIQNVTGALLTASIFLGTSNASTVQPVRFQVALTPSPPVGLHNMRFGRSTKVLATRLPKYNNIHSVAPCDVLSECFVSAAMQDALPAANGALKHTGLTCLSTMFARMLTS